MQTKCRDLVRCRPLNCLNCPPPEPIGVESAPSIQLETLLSDSEEAVKHPIAKLFSDQFLF